MHDKNQDRRLRKINTRTEHKGVSKVSKSDKKINWS